MVTYTYDDEHHPVALLAEGVDRNISVKEVKNAIKMSPSSRRAWIEISYRTGCCGSTGKSPSSRRAWIEIVLSVGSSL